MAGFGVQTNSDKVHSKTMQVPSYRLIVVRGTIEREREERKSLLAIVQARKRQLTVGKQQCWWWSDDQFMFCERKKRKNTEKVRDEWACFITIGCFYRNLKHQTKSSCAATEAFRLHLCFASVPTSKFNREKGNHGDKWLRCDFNIPFRNHQLLGEKRYKAKNSHCQCTGTTKHFMHIVAISESPLIREVPALRNNLKKKRVDAVWNPTVIKS